MQREGDERGRRLRVQTKVSLQPAHNALLSSSCAFRYLSLLFPSSSLSRFLLTASPALGRAHLSTLILFVLSMLYIAEVTSGRNVLLPGVYAGRDLPPFLPPSMFSLVRAAVYFRRRHPFARIVLCILRFHSIRNSTNE